MYLHFFVTTVFFFAINSQDDEWFVFNNGAYRISKCLGNNLLKISVSPKEIALSKVISVLVGKKFEKMTVTKKSLCTGVDYLFWELQNEKPHLFSDFDISKDYWKTMVKMALENCAVNRYFTNGSISEYHLQDTQTPVVPGTRNLCQNNEQFYFNHDEISLSRCIERNQLKRHTWDETTEVSKVIANLTAKRFVGWSLKKKELHKRVSRFFFQLRHGKLYQFLRLS